MDPGKIRHKYLEQLSPEPLYVTRSRSSLSQNCPRGFGSCDICINALQPKISGN